MDDLDKIKRLYNLIEDKISFGYQEDELIELETRLKTNLPKRLKEYYLTLGKNENINYYHNRLLKPNKEIGFSNDRYLMFYEENQVVASWGIKEKDLKLDNPPVWGNYGTNESPDWQLETKTTESFFLLMSVYNGTFGGLKYNANSFDTIKPKVVKAIKKKWVEVTEISWAKQKIYTDSFDEILSLSFDEKENCTAIFIGTSKKDRFDNLLDNLNIDWSYVSYEDDEEDSE